MAYYYVKSGGTASGDGGRYASQKTGSWATAFTDASEYYDELRDAILATTIPADGDLILLSDVHAFNGASSGTPNVSGSIEIISVDDDDIELYSPGASDLNTNAFSDKSINSGINAPVLIQGMEIGSADDSLIVGGQNTELRVIDATLSVTGPSDICLNVTSLGSSIELINTTLKGFSGSIAISTNGGDYQKIHWYGGAVDTMTTLHSTPQCGCELIINGVDLSPVTTLISGLAGNDDGYRMVLSNCTLNSSVTIPTMQARYQRFEMYNCDDSSGVLHRFYIAGYAGTASNNDTTYVTTTESWYDGSDKSSIEVTTTANCSHKSPFVFELPAQYIDLSSASSDVLTLDLVTDSTALSLTNTDIAAFLVYPDGTTAVQANWVTSGKTVGTGNYGIDPLAAGTALSASSLGAGDWTGEPASANFYKMELDTSGDAGQATACSVRIEVYKASIASGKLFIHPLMTTS